jgi:hypothetical protein
MKQDWRPAETAASGRLRLSNRCRAASPDTSIESVQTQKRRTHPRASEYGKTVALAHSQPAGCSPVIAGLPSVDERQLPCAANN